MFNKQTDGKFEKWVESSLSTFEIRRLVAEIYFIFIYVFTFAWVEEIFRLQVSVCNVHIMKKFHRDANIFN